MMRMCGFDAALREEHAALLRDTLMLRDLLQHNQPYMVRVPVFVCLRVSPTDSGAQSLEQGTPAWHSARAGRLTASLFATAAGLSSYATARNLWQYRTGRVDGGARWEGNEHTTRGTALEPVALAAYTRLTGNAVQPCGLFLHATHSWLAASPDGLLRDDGLLEIKCPAREPHATLPPLYMPQVQGQLFVSGRAWAHFFSFCETAEAGKPVAALFEVRRSEEYWAWLLPRLRKFYACEQADIDPGSELSLAPGEQPPHVEVKCVRRWR
jgi:putative phage-type endonuclease